MVSLGEIGNGSEGANAGDLGAQILNSSDLPNLNNEPAVEMQIVCLHSLDLY